MKTKTDDAPESIWDFAARRIGREAADTLVSPMVTGVFGGDAKQLSLKHCFPRMDAMEREHGSLFKALQAKRKQSSGASPMGPGGTLTSFEEGIGFLPRTAADGLAECLRSGVRVAKLSRENGRFNIELDNGDAIEAQVVVNALPAKVNAPLIEPLAPDAAKAFGSTGACNISVICTAYSRDKVGHAMDGFGFLAPRFEKKRILGCIWTSSVFPNQTTNDRVLVRTMIGGATDPEAIRLSDAEMLEHVKREVHPLLRIESAPDEVRIFRHAQAIPQYGLAHEAFLEAVTQGEQANPGLFFAGNAYHGVGMNDCVVSARRAVERVREYVTA